MRLKTHTAIGIALLFGALPAIAQETGANAVQSEAVELDAIDIEDTRAPMPAYRGFIAEDSGLSIIDKESLTGLEDGSGDAMDALRLMPNVNFDVNHSSADRDSLLDLRPADISISGGQTYDNAFRIDGVGVNSVMDVSGDNPQSIFDVAGASAQSIFLDPSLIGSIELRDSNISARYGEFSGGVVDVGIRDPGEAFGFSLRYGYENDEMLDYITDDDADLSLADPPPEFTKWRVHGTVDAPVNDKLRLLFGFGRTVSDVTYPVSASYGDNFRGFQSTSDNYLVKGIYDFSDTLRLTSSLVYSPYESESAAAAGINNLVTSKGGGLTFKTELDGQNGELDWLVRASYVDSDASREAPGVQYNWSSAAPSIDFCSGSSCTTGGIGNLDQTQRDYALEGEASHPLFGGTFDFGGTISYVDAHKGREQDLQLYSRGIYDPDTVCADPTEASCIDGEIAATQYNLYPGFSSDAEILQGAVWAEQANSFGPVDVRAGLRVSGDDYLKNTNVAPRLSAVWNIRDDVQLTAGANRYYTRNLLAYAISEDEPDSYLYRRTGTSEGTDLVFSPDDWSLYRWSILTSYYDAELDTPYSDEATLALTFPAFQNLNGIGRLKAVQRWHRDQILARPTETIEQIDDDGVPYTRRVRYPSNEGKTNYVGLSAEWVGTWKNTSFTLNAAWSETYNNADDEGEYFDEYDPEELLEDFIYYQGQIMPKSQLQDEAYRENFATPFTANAAVRSTWLDEALDTTLWLYWKDEYETIGDTRENITIDGSSYDVYDIVTRDASMRVDLNATYTIPEFSRGRVQLEARVSNLFSNLPHTDVTDRDPYQLGRAVWLGINYVY
ncbi:TonB-dependent receptor plug domain-containing protein [uncultured Hyphomonas sp.]|uniref:TonB-dependent receptor plug domain-containing protein n=1 Tax=uncultured Hyphomonas sp. TaxID=225298 RepID=UPI002AAAD2C3|nr:TonB-dependent receptor plug domain-containing protein [uncultured Hyphomonas sp.]